MQDFSGHPFQVQLSRVLAHRGHTVMHTYATQYVTGRGRLELGPSDPTTLSIEGITCDQPMAKYAPFGRLRFEAAYADAWKRTLVAEPGDVVVACNVPLFALSRMRRFFHDNHQKWLLWHQDIYSEAIAQEVRRKLPRLVAPIAARSISNVERKIVRDADAVVAISEPFRARYREWGLDTRHVRVIPNWAPIDEITPRSRDNSWSMRLPYSALRLLYAGTLGRKHNPLLLLDLTERARAAGVDCGLVVVSEGDGVDSLAEIVVDRDYVTVEPFQSACDLPEVLASADVLVALLEPGASEFSVPSKVASYLASGRPVLLFAALDNPAAAAVRDAGGMAVTPDEAGVAAAVAWLLRLAEAHRDRNLIGRQARTFAETNYDVDRVADQFEAVFDTICHGGRARQPVSTLACQPYALRQLWAPKTDA